MTDLYSNPAALSQVLAMLTANDTATIRQGEKILKQFTKQPNCILALLGQVRDSPEATHRHHAALLLKKKIEKHFPTVDASVQNLIKVEIINIMKAEPVKVVSVAIAGSVSTLARSIFSVEGGNWPELFALLMELAQSPIEQLRTLNYSLLEQLAENLAEHLLPHTGTLAQMFTMGCQDPVPAVATAAMKATTLYMNAISESPEVLQLKGVLSPILSVMQACLTRGDEEVVSEGLEIFQECIMMEQPLVNDHIEIIVPFVVAILQADGLDSPVKQAAGQTLMNVMEARPKLVAKKQLITPVLSALAGIIAKADTSAAGSIFSFAETEGRLDHEDDDDDEDYTPEMDIQRMAQTCIDTMAIHIPQKHFVGPALAICSQGMSSPDPQMRKAGCALLGVIAEGCCDSIREQLPTIMPALLSAVQDPEYYVREVGCFALGQFAEHCQPEILHYHGSVLPVVFQALEDAKHTVQGTSCYVLEMFCENLQPATLRPVLHPLLTRLAALLASEKQITQEMALSAIAATAIAADKDFLPFAEPICALLHPKLLDTEPGHFSVRGRSLECLGHIAVAIGSEHFARYFEAGMMSAVQAMSLGNDDLKEHSYVFFANSSKVMGAAFVPYLASLVPHLKEVIAESEIVYGDDKEDEEDEDIDEDDDDDDGGIRVNAQDGFVNTRRAALTALGSLAEYTKEQFFPYLQEIMATILEEPTGIIWSLVDTIRSEALSVLQNFVACACIAEGLVASPPKGQLIALSPTVTEVSRVSLKACVEAMEKDSDRSSVASACDSVTGILDKIGVAALMLPDENGQPYGQRLLKIILLLLQEQAPCQAKMEDPDDEDDDHDNVAMDTLTDLIGTLAKTVGPGFVEHFDVLLPQLLRFVKDTRPHSDRSMAIGCLAEVIQEVGPAAAKYVETTLPIVQKGLLDPMEGVRRNSAFCVGVLVESVGRDMVPLFLQLLQMLHPLCTRKEVGPDKGGADVDNALSAVARMIKLDAEAVPLEAVLPAMLAALPLQSDEIEGPNVYSCLTGLIETSNPKAMSLLPQVLQAFGQVLAPGSKMTDEVKGSVVQFLKTVSVSPGHSAAVAAALALVPDAEIKQLITAAISS